MSRALAGYSSRIPATMDANHALSRRNFIKGVIATGAVATSASYLFRGSGAVSGQASPAAAPSNG